MQGGSEGNDAHILNDKHSQNWSLHGWSLNEVK